MTPAEILARLPAMIPTSHSCLIRLPVRMTPGGVFLVPYGDGRCPPFFLIFVRPAMWTEEALGPMLGLAAEQLAWRTAFLARHLVN